jgi:hypothetical protein
MRARNAYAAFESERDTGKGSHPGVAMVGMLDAYMLRSRSIETPANCAELLVKGE